MDSQLYANEILIDDRYVQKHKDALFLPSIDGEGFGRGYDPSEVDYREIQTVSSISPPREIELLSIDEIIDRALELEQKKGRISDRLRSAKIPSTNQAREGYCWFYSTTGAVQAQREMAGQPFVQLNGHSGASIIKKGANQGGWCGQSMRFAIENGIAPMGTGPGEWPEFSRDYRRYQDSCKDSMAKYRIDEGWVDLSKPEWDNEIKLQAVLTLLVTGTPCALDFNWWGHSVLGCDAVVLSRSNRVVVPRIRNSWTDRWGDLGFSTLTESQARPDGGVGIASVRAAA